MIKRPQNKYKKIRNNIEQPLMQSQKEQFVLKISLCCAIVLAIFGIAYGIYIGSKAIIFDGLVAFLSIILILLSVITSKFIYKEDDSESGANRLNGEGARLSDGRTTSHCRRRAVPLLDSVL